MKTGTLLTTLSLLTSLCRCQVTAQAVVRTLYKTLNKTHTFTIKNSVEYYVKFTVPQDVIKKLENEKDKHIFQVEANERDSGKFLIARLDLYFR